MLSDPQVAGHYFVLMLVEGRLVIYIQPTYINNAMYLSTKWQIHNSVIIR